MAIVLAVNWPPQAPAPGEATASSSASSSSDMLAGGVGADGLEHVLDRHVLAAVAARRDRAAVEHQARQVEARERHHAARDRLVAARERDHGVEQVAARDQLDRVGDHLAAHERGLHPLGAHRDPVGDRDRVELHRRAAGGAHAVLDPLGEAAQVEVAGHRLGPGVGDADDRALERVVVEADALQVGARGGPVRAVEHDPAAAAEVPASRRRSRARRRARPALPTRRAARGRAARGRGRAGARRGACWRAGSRAPSSEVSAIHLASTSSEAGRRERPGAPVRSGNSTQYSLSSRPLSGHVGHDRLVRVDEVGVGGRGAGLRVAPSRPCTRMKPRSRYIAHSSSFTQQRSSSRARCSARRSRPGSYGKAVVPGRAGAGERAATARAPRARAAERRAAARRARG